MNYCKNRESIYLKLPKIFPIRLPATSEGLPFRVAITLPENFAYFGNEFSHVYVNENGFLTFGNGGNLTDLPWYDHQFTSDMRNAPPNAGGGRVLSYLDDLGSYSNSPT